MRNIKKGQMCAACAPSALVAGFCPQNPSRQTYCTLPWADDALMPSSLRCPPLCVFVADNVGTRAYPHPAPFGTQRCATVAGRGRSADGAPRRSLPPAERPAAYVFCAASPPFAADCQGRCAVKEGCQTYPASYLPPTTSASRRLGAILSDVVGAAPARAPAEGVRATAPVVARRPAASSSVVGVLSTAPRRNAPPGCRSLARLPTPPIPPSKGGASAETRRFCLQIRHFRYIIQ